MKVVLDNSGDPLWYAPVSCYSCVPGTLDHFPHGHLSFLTVSACTNSSVPAPILSKSSLSNKHRYTSPALCDIFSISRGLMCAPWQVCTSTHNFHGLDASQFTMLIWISDFMAFAQIPASALLGTRWNYCMVQNLWTLFPENWLASVLRSVEINGSSLSYINLYPTWYSLSFYFIF